MNSRIVCRSAWSASARRCCRRRGTRPASRAARARIAVLLLGREAALVLAHQQRVDAQVVAQQREVAGDVGQRRQQRGQVGIERVPDDVVVGGDRFDSDRKAHRTSSSPVPALTVPVPPWRPQPGRAPRPLAHCRRARPDHDRHRAPRPEGVAARPPRRWPPACHRDRAGRRHRPRLAERRPRRAAPATSSAAPRPRTWPQYLDTFQHTARGAADRGQPRPGRGASAWSDLADRRRGVRRGPLRPRAAPGRRAWRLEAVVDAVTGRCSAR